jgi:hypothetical membrane protein
MLDGLGIGAVSMNERNKDIAIFLSLLSIVSVFLIGITQWPKYKESHLIIGKHLYYICVSFVMYAFSVVAIISANNLPTKILSCIAFALFGTNIWVEFYGNPEQWTDWDKWTFVAFLCNLFLALFIVEKIKSNR